MTRNSIFGLGLATLVALGLATSSAQAQNNIADAKSALFTAAASPVTASVTDNPVVTYIISDDGTNSTFLIQDGTGAIEVYKNVDATYAPSIGDTLSLNAQVYGFHGLVEIESPFTSVTKTGIGTTPAPIVFTTTGLTNGSPTGFAQQSMLGSLGNVSFVGASGTFASGSYTVTDGVNSATVFVPSSATGIIGQAIPTGQVNIFGYANQYDSAISSHYGPSSTSFNGYELDPISITAVAAPEPGSVTAMLIGTALLGLVAIRRRCVAN